MNRTATTGESEDGPVQVQAGDAEVHIDPTAGARLTSLRVFGHEVLMTSGIRGFPNGSFVMAPWAGRIRDGEARWEGQRRSFPPGEDGHALHGLVKDRAWRRIGETSWSVTVDEDEWFGPLEIRQHLDLRVDSLRLDLEVLPLEAETAPAPATVGWHPWFRREVGGTEVDLELPDAWLLERDEDGIATDRRIAVPAGPWDDAFTDLAGPVSLTWPGVLALEIASEAPVTVVFTERPDAVCVEPQSGPPDEVNGSPPPVTDEEPLHLTTTWSWRSLGPT
jgi:aldose 1-epimerase